MSRTSTRTRTNMDKWLVAWSYSYIEDAMRWRVWKPGQLAAERITFDSPGDAHKWIDLELTREIVVDPETEGASWFTDVMRDLDAGVESLVWHRGARKSDFVLVQ